jgi:PAS domain S-box-containing protein
LDERLAFDERLELRARRPCQRLALDERVANSHVALTRFAAVKSPLGPSAVSSAVLARARIKYMRPPAPVTQLTSVGTLSWENCRLLVESVSDYAIFMLDCEGRVQSWNLGAQRIKGYAAEEIVGCHFSKFYPEEDVAAGKPELELKTAVQFGRVEDEGWRIRKDGNRFWASVVITALRDESGTLCGFGKITRDLTQRRLADEDLLRSEERFHNVIDAITDYAVFMLDATGHVATWNTGARRIKGYDASEIIGQHFSVFYTPEDRAADKPAHVLETVRREGRYEEEGFRQRKDGTRFWASVIITALRNDAGELTGFAKVTRDLTERRTAEESLRRSEERFRLLVAGVVDYAIYMLSPEGRVTTWNLGAERMKGYRAEEIIGKHFAVFFPEEDRRAGKPSRELETALLEGRFADEGWRVRKNGTRFWANVVLTPLHDDAGHFKGFAKITRDLTARREAAELERNLLIAEAARQAAESIAKKADEANRIKDEFLATVSHELRTPLNAIVGWASILRQRPLEPSLAKAIEVIDRNAHAQAKIIEDILDVSRIITGKLRVEPRPTDLVAIAKEAIEVIRPSADAKQLSIHFKPESEMFLLVGDPERLQQVIWNLLSNAVKFTEPPGFIHIVIEQQGSTIVLSVSDTGKGIDPEFLPFAFDRFKQYDGSTTRRHGGLGLGLALVRHIIELHGGSVAAESAGVGHGSKFSIMLPVRAVIPAMARERPGSARPPRPSADVSDALQGLRVLIVDDDADARELVSSVLSEAGAVTQTASSASEGLQTLSQFRPHVLVSDIGMPEEDGYAFVRRVRALDPSHGGGIPSVALTAYARSSDRTKALAAGFTTHIGKPVNPDDLVAAVANLAAFARR